MTTRARCTWLECPQPGYYPKKSKDGSTWATLCFGHHVKVTQAFQSGSAKGILSVWIKAQGGPALASNRILPSVLDGLTALMARIDAKP